MKLEESLGIVTENGKQWDDLCITIVDYVYDLVDGLIASPFNMDEQTIYMQNIISYYKYKNGKLDPYLIPSWIGDFEVILDNELVNKGRFEKLNASLKNNKLYFTIRIKDYAGLSGDEFNETLIHEFRHAYTTWIEKTKNISIRKNNQMILYKDGTKGFNNEKFDKTFPLIKKFDDSHVEIDLNIYNQPIKVEQYILRSFYYIDIDEINSFLQEFGTQMKTFIKKTYKGSETIDFNTMANNKFIIPCYRSQYYRTYAAYLEFWNNIDNVNKDDAEIVVENIKMPLKRYLNIDSTKKLIPDGIDAMQILKRLAKKEIPIYKKVLKKMEKLNTRLSINAENDNKQNIIISSEAQDPNFEQELLNLIK